MFAFEEDDEDIHMAIERRLTELAGPVGGKLHTARSRNDQVATDVAMYVREQARAAHDAVGRADGRAGGPRRGAPSTGRCPATPTRSAPSRCTSPTTCSPTSGCSPATASGSRSPLDPGRAPAARRRRAGRGQLRHRPPRVRPPARLPRRRAQLARRASPTVTSRSTTCTPPPPAPPTSRAWARSSCCGPARRSASASCPTRGRRAPRSCRRRRTPTPPSCCAPRRPASSGTYTALQGVLHALPLTYNKDLQEDKEHLFDTADTLELELAAARGMVEGVRFTRERMAAAAADELLGATDVADMLVRHGVPFREAHGVVAGLVRAALEDAGGSLSELTPAELAAHSPVLGEHAEEYRQLLTQSSWLESKVSEGGTASRARARAAAARARRARAPAPPRSSQPGSGATNSCDPSAAATRGLGGRRPRCPPSAAGFAVRRRAPPRRARCRWSSTPGRCVEVARALVGCVVEYRAAAGRDRRDRGLPRERAGVPRVRRARPRAPARCSAAPAARTCTAPTASTRC